MEELTRPECYPLHKHLIFGFKQQINHQEGMPLIRTLENQILTPQLLLLLFMDLDEASIPTTSTPKPTSYTW